MSGAPALPGAVLFACTYNRVRSPIAAALMRMRFGARVFVDSCGLKGGGEVDPFVVAAMDEQGADLSAHRPKRFDQLEDGSFDAIVSLSPEAHHGALEFARHMSADVIYWPTLDPTQVEGSREARLDAYREVRDALDARILAHFGRAATFGG